MRGWQKGTTVPPSRFTVHHDALSGRWYVHDRLLFRRVHIAGSGTVASDVARDYEAAWRDQCERWIEAEWQGDLL